MARVVRWLRPRGAPVFDGLRLAAINIVGLIVAVVWVAVISVVTRLADRIVPVPVLFTGFFAVLIALGVGAWMWFRYGAAHGDAARASGADPKPNVFGAVAASPFAALAAILVSFSVMGFFFAAITFSGSRFVDALRQLGFAALFLAVAAANVAIIRASSGGARRGS